MRRRLTPLMMVVAAACVDAPAPLEHESTSAPALDVAATLDSASITAGYRYACALDLAGHAWCWGSSQYGQLGAPTTKVCDGVPCSPRPLAVVGAPAFVQISAGFAHDRRRASRSPGRS